MFPVSFVFIKWKEFMPIEFHNMIAVVVFLLQTLNINLTFFTLYWRSMYEHIAHGVLDS